jgi:hypothetical protein
MTGHRRIEGNKTFNQMARMGSEHPYRGPDLVRGISARCGKKAARE